MSTWLRVVIKVSSNLIMLMKPSMFVFISIVHHHHHHHHHLILVLLLLQQHLLHHLLLLTKNKRPIHPALCFNPHVLCQVENALFQLYRSCWPFGTPSMCLSVRWTNLTFLWTPRIDVSLFISCKMLPPSL